METSERMKQLLALLEENFNWLFSEYGFKVLDTEESPSFGGEGMVMLENETLRIELISDRDRAYLEFSPKNGWKKGETVTFDLLHQLLSNEIRDETTITSSQINYLKNHFPDIISLFGSAEANNLLKKVKKLKKDRAKRLFG